MDGARAAAAAGSAAARELGRLDTGAKSEAEAGEEAEAVYEEDRAIALRQWLALRAGVLAVYAAWGIMVWMVRSRTKPSSAPLLHARRAARGARAHVHVPLAARAAAEPCPRSDRQIFVYGELIYKLLGERVEGAFARSWMTGLGVDQAVQWQDVAKGAAESAALLLLLDQLRVLPNPRWLERHVDMLSVQATLLTGTPQPLRERLRAHLKFYGYVR